MNNNDIKNLYCIFYTLNIYYIIVTNLSSKRVRKYLTWIDDNYSKQELRFRIMLLLEYFKDNYHFQNQYKSYNDFFFVFFFFLNWHMDWYFYSIANNKAIISNNKGTSIRATWNFNKKIRSKLIYPDS